MKSVSMIPIILAVGFLLFVQTFHNHKEESEADTLAKCLNASQTLDEALRLCLDGKDFKYTTARLLERCIRYKAGFEPKLNHALLIESCYE